MPFNGRTAVRILVPIFVAAVTLIMIRSGEMARLDLPIRDLFLELRTEREATFTSVVTIDDASLARLGPWPWPRDLLAGLIASIRVNDPSVIVLDILLVDPTELDPALATELDRSDTVLAAALNDDRNWIMPLPALADHAQIGHASLDLDHDGVMRRLTSTRQAGGISLPALSILATTLDDPRRIIPVARRVSPDFSTRPSAVPSMSASSVLERGNTIPELQGRIVFIGVTAPGLGDRVMTPVSDEIPVPGVLVHAAMTESILQGGLLTPMSPWLSALVAAVLSAVALRLTDAGGWTRAIVAVAVIALPAVAGLVLLEMANLEIPIATLTLFPVLAVLGVELHSAFFTSVTAARTEAILGDEIPSGPALSPEERMKRLLELAERIGRERREESSSRRALAHELKTPLTSVRGLAQLLSGFDLSREERERVGAMMVRETTRLQSLIEQLLDIERIQLAGFEEEARPVDLAELTLSRSEFLGSAGSHPIDTAIEPRLGVLGRSDLLTLLIDNLIGNAMKYSPQGSPIRVRLSKEGSRIVLEVEDAGPGIPEGERESIFNRFSRGTSAEGTDGLGLGLALVREIAVWHRGRIEVVPARFRGSIFRVELPARESSRKEVAS